MEKIITSTIYKIENDKNFEIIFQVNRSHFLINREFAMYFTLQIGSEFCKKSKMIQVRKEPCYKTLLKIFLELLKEWFMTRPDTVDSIRLENLTVMFDGKDLKYVL